MRIFCIILAVLCLMYYIRCATYAGIKSSFIWIWLVGTAFFLIIYIFGLLEARQVYVLPWTVKGIAGVVLGTGVVLFITLELCIIFSMRQKPVDNCDYIIVLGCQIRGDRVTDRKSVV